MWQLNHNKQRKEDTSVNSNSDTQQSNMQEHIVNWIPANSEWEKNLIHIPLHRNRDKPDENTNTYTQYERTVKKPDRLTYHKYIIAYILTDIGYMDK